MVNMACGYSIGKKKFRNVEGDLKAIQHRCDSISRHSLRLAAADAETYQQLADAMRQPRKTEKEKSIRQVAVALAAKTATAIPMELADLCIELIDLADDTCTLGNQNLIGDAAGGGSLARGVLRVCQLNIAANLPLLKDRDFAHLAQAQLDSAKHALSHSDKTVDRYL
jgi:formiminotetrahydrofolate cyclodeaminase